MYMYLFTLDKRIGKIIRDACIKKNCTYFVNIVYRNFLYKVKCDVCTYSNNLFGGYFKCIAIP